MEFKVKSALRPIVTAEGSNYALPKVTVGYGFPIPAYFQAPWSLCPDQASGPLRGPHCCLTPSSGPCAPAGPHGCTLTCHCPIPALPQQLPGCSCSLPPLSTSPFSLTLSFSPLTCCSLAVLAVSPECKSLGR